MSSPKKKILRVLNFFLFLSVGLLLMYFAFKGIDLENFWHNLKQANFLWVILALILALTSHLVRAYRWNLLIEPIGYKPRLLYTFYAVLIGYLANLAFPRIGEVTRCASLNRSDKIPLDSLLGTVIAERAIDLVSLVVLLMAVFLIRVEFYGKFINDKIFTPMVDSMAEWINLSIWFWVLILVLAVAPLPSTMFSATG